MSTRKRHRQTRSGVFYTVVGLIGGDDPGKDVVTFNNKSQAIAFGKRARGMGYDWVRIFANPRRRYSNARHG